MTDAELAEMKRFATDYDDVSQPLSMRALAEDVLALIAEVERLRAELEGRK